MESHWNLTQPEWWKISESVKNFLKELKEIRIKRRIQKNCDTCKCNLYIEDVCLCCIPEVVKAFKENKNEYKNK